MGRFTKLCAIVLSCCLFLPVAVACGGGGDDTDYLNVDVTQDRPALTGLFPASGSRDEEFASSYTTEILEEATGYSVSYYQQSSSNVESEVGNALMDSNTYSFIKMERGTFDQYVTQDAFLDLTELLEKYGQNILNTIPEELWASCMYDGKICAIPEYGFGYMQDNALVFNQSHLDAIGMDVPTTITEFTEVILALQEYYGSSDVNYHAFAMTAADASVSVLSAAFEMPIDFYEAEDGTVTNYIYADETYNYILWMNMLANQNCFPSNWDSATASTLIGWFANENISCAYLPYWYIASLCDTMSANQSTKYPTSEDARNGIVYQTRIKGDGAYGSVVQEQGKLRGSDDIGYFISIPYQSRATAAYVIDWINTRYEYENYKTATIGREGETYEIVSAEEATDADVPITEQDGSIQYYRLLEGYSLISGNSMYQCGGYPEIGRRYWPLREKNYNVWTILLPEEEDDLMITSVLAKRPVLEEWSAVSSTAMSFILTYLQRMINTTVEGDETVRQSVDWYLATVKSSFEKNYWTESCAAEVQEWYDSTK